MILFMSLCSFVFFFKQKTAYELRISDWSSDVCSSDLLFESGDHRDEGRDANTPRDEYGNLGVLSKLEIVARLADLQNLTDSQRIVHVGRTAATGRIARDRESIAIGEKRAVRQRIAAHQ